MSVLKSQAEGTDLIDGKGLEKNMQNGLVISKSLSSWSWSRQEDHEFEVILGYRMRLWSQGGWGWTWSLSWQSACLAPVSFPSATLTRHDDVHLLSRQSGDGDRWLQGSVVKGHPCLPRELQANLSYKDSVSKKTREREKEVIYSTRWGDRKIEKYLIG